MSASKGNVLHLGNVRTFLATLDSAAKAEKLLHTTIHSIEPLQKPGMLVPKIKLRR